MESTCWELRYAALIAWVLLQLEKKEASPFVFVQCYPQQRGLGTQYTGGGARDASGQPCQGRGSEAQGCPHTKPLNHVESDTHILSLFFTFSVSLTELFFTQCSEPVICVDSK